MPVANKCYLGPLTLPASTQEQRTAKFPWIASTMRLGATKRAVLLNVSLPDGLDRETSASSPLI
jgi:hypothetical protein